METKIGSQPCNINVGNKYGLLTVLRYTGNDKHGKRRWLCKCDCGKECVVLGSDIKRGHTTSCGCYDKKRRIKHGMSDTRMYKIWCDIKSRCNHEYDTNYNNYGGRGIRVCDEWDNDFMAFYDWSIVHGYNDKLTIDRIDVNGNYDPSNCRWISFYDQQYNKRNTKYYEYNGDMITIYDIMKITGLKYNTIKTRLNRGWSIEDIVNTPLVVGSMKGRKKHGNTDI